MSRSNGIKAFIWCLKVCILNVLPLFHPGVDPALKDGSGSRSGYPDEKSFDSDKKGVSWMTEVERLKEIHFTAPK